MDRITSNQVSDLMEAYASIYEGYGKKGKKKVMHDCATHVEHSEYGLGNCIKEMHTLDEEGNVSHYDVEFEHGIVENVPVSELNILVSEEHPHEANELKNAEVLDEMGQTMTTGQATAPKAAPKAAPAKPQRQLSGLNIGPGGFRINNKPVQTGMSPIFQRPGQAPARPAAPAARPAARPAAPAPAARPAAATRPAAPAPKAAPTTSTSYAGVKPATNAFTGNASIGTPTTTATPAKKPSLASQAAELRAMRAASQARQGLTQGFDVFDVIKGHLLDEGYADSEEAALKIMANMSEEWREEILEVLMPKKGN